MVPGGWVGSSRDIHDDAKGDIDRDASALQGRSKVKRRKEIGWSELLHMQVCVQYPSRGVKKDSDSRPSEQHFTVLWSSGEGVKGQVGLLSSGIRDMQPEEVGMVIATLPEGESERRRSGEISRTGLRRVILGILMAEAQAKADVESHGV